MKMCVDRVIEQYEALKLYFTGAAIEDPTHTNDSIMKSLNNKFTLAYHVSMSSWPSILVDLPLLILCFKVVFLFSTC